MMKEAINMELPKRKICSSPSSVPAKKRKKMEEGSTDSSIKPSPLSSEFSARDSPRVSQSAVQNGDVSSASSIFDPPCTSTLEEKTTDPQPDTKSKNAIISEFIEGLGRAPLSSLPPSPPAQSNRGLEICQPILADDPFDLLRKTRTPEKSKPVQIEESEFFSQPNSAALENVSLLDKI